MWKNTTAKITREQTETQGFIVADNASVRYQCVGTCDALVFSGTFLCLWVAWLKRFLCWSIVVMLSRCTLETKALANCVPLSLSHANPRGQAAYLSDRADLTKILDESLYSVLLFTNFVSVLPWHALVAKNFEFKLQRLPVTIFENDDPTLTWHSIRHWMYLDIFVEHLHMHK